MTNVSEEKIDQRWDALSPALREALTSEVNSDFLWRTCEAEHLPEEKIFEVGKVVGHILLGFIHPEDLGHELKTALTLNPQIADSISLAINNRIFEPLKDELGKIYEPPSKFGPLMTEPPKFIEEIKKPDKSRWLSSSTPPTATSPVTTAPPPPSPPKISGGNLGGEAAGPIGEFEKLGKVSPPAAAKTIEPPPTMLHEETPIKSAPQTSSFKIEAPTPKLSDIKTKESEIPRPAVIDFGGSTDSPQEKPSVPPPLPKTTVPESRPSDATLGKPPRIVHYTEFRTPLEKPQEKPPVISGAQAPSNIPLAENPLSKISGENPERKEGIPEPKTPPTPPAIRQL